MKPKIEWHTIHGGAGGIQYGSDPCQPGNELLTHALVQVRFGTWQAVVVKRGRTSLRTAFPTPEAAREWAEKRLAEAYKELTL